MTMKKIFLPCMLWMLWSCEQVLIAPDATSSPVSNFDLLWQTLDEKYSLFVYKDVDWDEVYARYRPQVSNDMSEEALFEVMDNMLYELRDGHVSLQSDFDVSRNWDWYLNYPPNYNANIIERNYLGRDYRIVPPFAAQVIKGVGYIRYSSFLTAIDKETLDPLLEQYRKLPGIIIDIRDNTGGFTHNASLLAEKLGEKTVEEIQVGYQRYKAGPAHDDFTQAFPVTLEPEHEDMPPVVILTNRLVYSAANLFTSYMSAFPNVTIIGDRTGGGAGAPYSAELYNGWTFSFSSTQMLDLSQNPIENGIAPDIKVNLLPQDEAQGIDTILETALDFILN